MMPTLKHFGVGSIPWSPLARGLLTRPNAQEGQTTRETSDRYLKGYSFNPSIVDSVEEIAKRKNVSMAQIAIAWLLNKEGVTAPIVGTTFLDKLKELIDAVHITLTSEEMKELEQHYKAQGVFGHT